MIIGERNCGQCISHQVDHNFWMNTQEITHEKGVKSCQKINESVLHQLLRIRH